MDSSNVELAVQAGEESVELADKTDDVFERMVDRTRLADALHQAGRWKESAASFSKAEAMQAEQQLRYPSLYSVPGYQYCDLLLAMAEPEDGSGLDGVVERPEWVMKYRKACEEVRERSAKTLEDGKKAGDPLLDTALDHLALGRAHFGLALTSEAPPGFTEATAHLDLAVDGLRQANVEHHIPRGLLDAPALTNR